MCSGGQIISKGILFTTIRLIFVSIYCVQFILLSRRFGVMLCVLWLGPKNSRAHSSIIRVCFDLSHTVSKLLSFGQSFKDMFCFSQRSSSEIRRPSFVSRTKWLHRRYCSNHGFNSYIVSIRLLPSSKYCALLAAAQIGNQSHPSTSRTNPSPSGTASRHMCHRSAILENSATHLVRSQDECSVWMMKSSYISCSFHRPSSGDSVPDEISFIMSSPNVFMKILQHLNRLY